MDAQVTLKISPPELKRLETAVETYHDQLIRNMKDEQLAPGSEPYQDMGQDIMYLESILRALR